jgi:sugar lactone lactonase YvrE
LFLVIPRISPNAKWAQNGVTIAGGNGQDNGVNQLNRPYGIYVDSDRTVFIADTWNHRVVEWKSGETSGQIVAGSNEPRNQPNQLNRPIDVIVDKATDSLIICSRGNQRVIQWSRRSRTSGEIIIENIDCLGLTMDDQGLLYVSNWEQHEVRRYRVGEMNGTVVAGGNGQGDRLDQLCNPTYVFVDRDRSVYVSDYYNHRVMKWIAGAKQGIVVAGGRGQGNSSAQLSHPRGVSVDPLGRVYVSDSWNHRVMRWCNGATEGNVIVGGNGREQQANQLVYPIGLSFDRDGNLYVVDCENDRVQRFSIEY